MNADLVAFTRLPTEARVLRSTCWLSLTQRGLFAASCALLAGALVSSLHDVVNDVHVQGGRSAALVPYLEATEPTATPPRCEQIRPASVVAPLPALLEHLDGSSGCRTVPAFRDGRAEGLKLFGIRPGSALADAGMRNGDVLTCVNGYRLTSPNGALAAWDDVAAKASLRATVERGSLTLLLHFEQP